MAKIAWNADNLVGRKFGKLTVLSKEKTINKKSRWLCVCDCGKMTIVRGAELKKGKTSSCGCFAKEMLLNRNLKYPYQGMSMSKTRLYKIWVGIKKRCFNNNSKSYKNYGGRGITVCGEWKNDFMSFYNWATTNGYKDDLTIDRINNDGNYEPGNCRFSNKKEQCRNTRRNHKVLFAGKMLCFSQIAELVNKDQRYIWKQWNNKKLSKLEHDYKERVCIN